MFARSHRGRCPLIKVSARTIAHSHMVCIMASGGRQVHALSRYHNNDGGAALSAGGAVAAGRPTFANPQQVGAVRRMQEFVTDTRALGRRKNTAKAFDPKTKEYEEFCEHVYKDDPFKYNVNEEKCYQFMFYQAFREQKKKGGKRSEQAKTKFNHTEYKEIMKPFTNAESPAPFPTPKKPIGIESFNQYRQIIKQAHQQQIVAGVNNKPWEFIWDLNCKKLEKHVKERKPAIDKANYVEKQCAEFTPYLIVQHYGNIEEELWNDAAAAPNRRALNSRLRHRCCALYLTGAVLRSESLHRADVSDFFGLEPPMKSNDVHQPYLMINQIAEGKTTHGHMQWGRATRHKDVKRCPIGATAMYMENREEILSEFQVLEYGQWKKNSEWFDIKFLVDANGGDNTKEMTCDTYATHIKTILQKLGLPTNKVLHLGRNIGAKWLDVQEINAEEIRRMGQWNQTIYDKSYSSKLPMGAIRSLAGFTAADGMYFNTRTQVMPTAQLCKMTALGKFAFPMLAQLEQDEENHKHPTAMACLRWFCKLSMIYLQDMTAMFCLFPERKDCALYENSPVLQTPEFEVRSVGCQLLL
jgi:Centromere DNA-binding protein complex CBF3 subunit, domain 2